MRFDHNQNIKDEIKAGFKKHLTIKIGGHCELTQVGNGVYKNGSFCFMAGSDSAYSANELEMLYRKNKSLGNCYC